MPWKASLSVTDCASSKKVVALVTDGQTTWASDSSGQFTVVVPDIFSQYTVFVEGGGYVNKTFTFERASAENKVQSLCLDKARPATPAAQVAAPRITGTKVDTGRVTITWDAFETNQFNVRLTPIGGSFPGEPFEGQRELDGGDRSFTERKVQGGRTYRFSIQRCRKGLIDFHSNCSEWASIDIPVTPEQGYQPWRRWFQLHPETQFDHASQQVAVVSRAPGNIDLFAFGFDNALYTTFWNEAGGGWNPEGWIRLHPETQFDHASQQVAVVSRAPGNIDLFAFGFDNALYTTFWNEAGGGWNPEGWIRLHPETQFDHASQQVAVVSRAPGNIDLFAFGFDNSVWTSWWAEE
ncbi:hypothetical protein ACQPX6_28475 [Actinomycetospora sp. CA-101289]|uniref:hypothetical protein n=1 Tax=Actinomycetospora sp. CA-101289 TaxID=3239893 RepID=UPI003D985DC9